MSKNITPQNTPFITLYNRSQNSGISFTEPTKTQQHHANDTNINTIVNKYTKTQLIQNHELKNIPEQYGEFTNFDYSDSMDKMAKIKQDFESLPSEMRAEFNNDPALWYNIQIKEQLTEAMEQEAQELPSEIDNVDVLPKTELQTENPTAVGGA